MVWVPGTDYPSALQYVGYPVSVLVDGTDTGATPLRDGDDTAVIGWRAGCDQPVGDRMNQSGPVAVALDDATRTAVATPQLYRVPEAMRLLSLSRSVIYEQIRVGRLKSVTQGRTRLIPAAAISDYISLLQREADGDRTA